MSDDEAPFKDMSLADIAIQCIEDSEEWFPDRSGDMGYLTICLAGETGEFANLIKKGMRGTYDFEDQNYVYALAMELTDVFIYLMNIVGQMDIDMEKLYQIKREINRGRFGDDGDAGKTELRVL
jgi:NTP pyrophosphatase (non-canonical NTP hydrolase)